MSTKKNTNATHPTLTSLLSACFKFDAEATDEERQLLLGTFEYWHEWSQGPFAVVMASQALHELGVHVGVDTLEDRPFLDLLSGAVAVGQSRRLPREADPTAAE